MSATSSFLARPLFRAALLAGACLATSCALPSLDVTPRYASLSLDGDFGASSSNVTATANLDEAGLDDTEGTPSLRADLKWGMPHLILSTHSASFSGSGTVDADIELDGDIIMAGTAVDSDLDLGVHSGVLVFDLFPGKNFEVGVGFGATLLDLDVLIRDQGSTDEVATDELIPIPVIALNLGTQIGPVELAGYIAGISIDVDGDKASFFDADVFARYHMFGGKNRVRASIVGGWRQSKFDVDYDDGGDNVEAEFDLSGPYLGVEFTL